MNDADECKDKSKYMIQVVVKDHGERPTDLHQETETERETKVEEEEDSIRTKDIAM